jgi:hypothetical protein
MDISGLVGTVTGIFGIYDRIKSMGSAIPEHVVCKRFIELFESHDVHKNEIPRFFGHDINLSDLDDPKLLLAKLDSQILDDACELFGVQRYWLDGASEEIYMHRSFYKDAKGFREFITDKRNSGVQIGCVLYLSNRKTSGSNSCFALQEKIGEIGDKDIYKYNFIDSFDHRYWRSRAYISAQVAILLDNKVRLSGRWVKSDLHSIAGGYKFPSYLETINLDTSEYNRRATRHEWHPDSWIFNANDYLDGVDEGEFGKGAAISEWLKLYQQGFMKTGYVRESAKADFKAMLT